MRVRPVPPSALLMALLLPSCIGSGADQAEAKASLDTLAAPGQLTWQCGDQRVLTRYHDKALTVTLPERELRLSPAMSASGARFASGRHEFWSHGASEAQLILDGGAPIACTATDQPSPWVEARQRGVAFRAVGNEPGWMAEVDAGEAPAMRLVLDYGERRLTFPLISALSGGEGFRGEQDGVVAELRITREPCSDGMSDATYPASVVVTIGEQVYRGCGRFLLE